MPTMVPPVALTINPRGGIYRNGDDLMRDRSKVATLLVCDNVLGLQTVAVASTSGTNLQPIVSPPTSSANVMDTSISAAGRSNVMLPNIVPTPPTASPTARPSRAPSSPNALMATSIPQLPMPHILFTPQARLAQLLREKALVGLALNSVTTPRVPISPATAGSPAAFPPTTSSTSTVSPSPFAMQSALVLMMEIVGEGMLGGAGNNKNGDPAAAGNANSRSSNNNNSTSTTSMGDTAMAATMSASVIGSKSLVGGNPAAAAAAAGDGNNGGYVANNALCVQKMLRSVAMNPQYASPFVDHWFAIEIEIPISLSLSYVEREVVIIEKASGSGGGAASSIPSLPRASKK
jgi:hypothetical protein